MTDDDKAFIIETIRDELARLMPVITEQLAKDTARRVVEAMRLRQVPSTTNSAPEVVAGAVETVYTRQGGKPAKTQAVALEAGYSRRYTLDLLKLAAMQGMVKAEQGRGQRCSGRWYPATVESNIA